jgi:hypothetical protein
MEFTDMSHDESEVPSDTELEYEHLMTDQQMIEYQYPEADSEEVEARLIAMKSLTIYREPEEEDDEVTKYEGLSASKLSGRTRSFRAMLKDCKAKLSDAKDSAIETGCKIEADGEISSYTFQEVVRTIKLEPQTEKGTLITHFLSSLIDTVKLKNQKKHLEKQLGYIEEAKGFCLLF